MSGGSEYGGEELAGGRESRHRRLAVLAWAFAGVAVVVVAIVVQHRHQRQQQQAEAAHARQVDAPVLQRLSRLKAGGDVFNPSARELRISVEDQNGDDVRGVQVEGLSLDGGTLGDPHAVVVDQYVGTGTGPLLEDVAPFQMDISGMRMVVTFDHPARCGQPTPNTPLVMTVRLPSGRVTDLRLPISVNFFSGRFSGRLSDARRVAWPRAMSSLACRTTHVGSQ